jgi:hypothetical protein
VLAYCVPPGPYPAEEGGGEPCGSLTTGLFEPPPSVTVGPAACALAGGSVPPPAPEPRGRCAFELFGRPCLPGLGCVPCPGSPCLVPVPGPRPACGWPGTPALVSFEEESGLKSEK